MKLLQGCNKSAQFERRNLISVFIRLRASKTPVLFLSTATVHYQYSCLQTGKHTKIIFLLEIFRVHSSIDPIFRTRSVRHTQKKSNTARIVKILVLFLKIKSGTSILAWKPTDTRTIIVKISPPFPTSLLLTNVLAQEPRLFPLYIFRRN